MPSAIPNYLITRPSGATGAEFPGGVVMPTYDAQVSIAPGERAISWVNEAGTYVAQISTLQLPPSSGNMVIASMAARGREGLATTASAQLNADAVGALGASSYLSVEAGGNTSTHPDNRILARAGSLGNNLKLITNGEGASSFLQKDNSRAGSGHMGTYNPWSGIVFNLPYPAYMGAVVGCSCSGYANVGIGPVQYNMSVDGVYMGYNHFYFNQVGVHQNMGFIIGRTGPLAAGNHIIQFYNASGVSLAVDSEDSCAWFVLA